MYHTVLRCTSVLLLGINTLSGKPIIQMETNHTDGNPLYRWKQTETHHTDGNPSYRWKPIIQMETHHTDGNRRKPIIQMETHHTDRNPSYRWKPIIQMEPHQTDVLQCSFWELIFSEANPSYRRANVVTELGNYNAINGTNIYILGRFPHWIINMGESKRGGGLP